MKVMVIQTVVLCQKLPEQENSDSDGGNADRPLCLLFVFLIPPTLSPQYPKLTWAGESTRSLFTW